MLTPLNPLKNIDCGYSLEPPRRGGSNEYPQSIFWAEIWKISEFLAENFQFLGWNYLCYGYLGCQCRIVEKSPREGSKMGGYALDLNK